MTTKIREGYKQTEVGVIPEDWNLCKLEDVCERIGVGLATSVTKYYRETGIAIIRNLNIKNGYFDGNDMLYLDQEFAKQNYSKETKALDVLTVRTGSNLGLTCVLPFEYHNCQTFTTLVTTPNKLRLNSIYLCFNMSSIIGKSELSRLQVGGGKGNLNTGDLKKYRIAIPRNINEQTAIANSLSDSDALITSLEKLIEKKRAIKQGAMQELLKPKEGWEVKTLGEILKIIGGGAFKSSDSQKTGVKWLKIANVGINQILWNEENFLPIEFIIQNENFLLYEGDLVIALTRPLLDRKLKIASLSASDCPALLNQRVGKITAEADCDINFLYFLLQKHNVIDLLLQGMAGTDPPNLSNKGVYSISCSIPPTKIGQIQIATILSNMDAEITALEQKLGKYKLIKQGMMQELLTGKIRLI